ncbi:MAG: GPP34 family phosphoprotein [Brevibacterium sp.]|uniref:GOLPH3/VPS74 family protein n=1 Tax=Brevibacterium sandarakinum TaxID=629680 RepID=UPI002653F69E|nr:GPP34 family phosphoprotein [Brevibacterium sandarakinum]MDN5585022.1 GPP34 family phosphoprotein [Brevibacterium sp.]MDN5635811.1 GPP34 family phosphoprotein [Brevibacterium sp.]MDN5657511.1 GPP34 family phosphoprotein [Brevibacterium sandarakinum]
MDDRLLIAEEVMLLVLPDNGKLGIEFSSAEYPLTGAVLVELAMRGLIDIRSQGKSDKRYVRAVGASSPSDPLLADALAHLGEDEHEVSSLIGRLVPKIQDTVLGRLAERGIIEREEARFLWVFPTTHWPEKNARPEAELRERVSEVLVGRAEPDERIGSIIALLSASQLIKQLRPPLPWDKTVEKRVKDIEKGSWSSAAVSEAVNSVMLAVTAAMVAITAATAATTAATM